jgi:hypothetical protein
MEVITMYENIGMKIKNLSKLIFGLETALAIIIALIYLFGEGIAIFIGLLILIIGPIVAWLSSLVLYGFGELIDKTSEVAKNTRYFKKMLSSTEDDIEENKEKISTTFKTNEIMDIPKRNKKGD